MRSATEDALLQPAAGSARDPVLPLLVALGTATVGLAAFESRSQAAEIAFLFAAVAAAYILVWTVARLLPLAAIAGFLSLEHRLDRLDGRHYWQEAVLAAVIAAAVLLAGYLRLITDRRRDAVLDADAALEASRAADALRLGVRSLPPLDYELERARRHSHQVSLLVVRPDDLHHVERTYGEAGARAVVERLGRVLVGELRATDVALHVPPFDVWLILPETPSIEARSAAERIRLAVAAEPIVFAPGEAVHVSVSVGGASFPDDGTTNDEVEQSAARALARAGELGGNRSVMCSLPPEVPSAWTLSAR